MLSMTKLKRSLDNGSPYLKPRTVSKGSKSSIPPLTELQELLNGIVHNLIRHCAKNTIRYEVIEGSLRVDKKMVSVDLCFVCFFQDLE